LPTGPAYASAADSAPPPPVKPQVVAALQQPSDVASDASTDEPQSSAGPKFLAPLPPRRPADLAALALADAPMPPARPADLILASKTDQGGNAFAPPSNKGFNAAVPRDGSLPKVITAGVDRSTTGALALAEGLSPPTYDDSELLARAAELTAPLPPMPIPNVGASAAPAPDSVGAVGDRTTAPPQSQGYLHAAANRLARLFDGLSFGAFGTSTKSDESRGAE
jgi:hypothetical protein